MSISLILTNMTNGQSETKLSILDGDTYSWRIDDSLDSGVIMYTDNNLTPIEPFTLATINFDDGSTEKMFVAEDSVSLVAKMSATKTYQHTLKLVELTKILEKILINGLCMTPIKIGASANMYSSLSAQLDRVEQAIYNTYTYNIFIKNATGVSTALTSFEPETFIFNNSTAREILDELFSAIDSRVVITNAEYDYYSNYSYDKKLILTLDYIKMESTTSETLANNTHHTLISESASNSVESYAGSICSHVESAQGGNEISLIDTFKANDAIATSSNRVMSLPYAIIYPKTFKIQSTTAKIKVKGTYYVSGDSSAHTFTEDLDEKDWFDALDYFVDYEYWQTLSLVNQQKTLYYKRGELDIDISRTYKSLIVTKSVFTTMFNEILQQAYTDNYSSIYSYMSQKATALGGSLTSITLDTVTTGDVDDILFDITYIGEVEGLATSTKKDNRTKFERDLSIVDNQSANIVDITRYGQNLKGKIDRLGNNQFYIDCDVDSYTNILPLLTKITEYDAIIYQVDISRHTDKDTWYEVRYYLAKNYNNLNERIALKREKRIYAIPTKGYQVILPKKETIVISDYLGRADNEHISIDNTSSSYMIADALCGNKPVIRNAFIETSDGTNTNKFVLPVSTYGSGNTMNFVCKFYDNASAGLSIDTTGYGGINWLGGKKVCYNKYTNDYGWAIINKIDWGYFTNPRITAGVRAQPKRLLMPLTDGLPAEASTTVFTDNYYYEKDPSEAIGFQKIITIEPSRDNIIIGRFPEYNCLLQSMPSGIWLYYQTTDRDPYKQGDKKVRYDSNAGDVRTYVRAVATLSVSNGYVVRIEMASLINIDKYNIALGDGDGNLLVAANGLTSGQRLFTVYPKEARG